MSGEKATMKVEIAEWEGAMADELGTKYNIPWEAVIDIGVTFLINEMSAAANGKPALINTLRPKDEKIDLPDVDDKADYFNVVMQATEDMPQDPELQKEIVDAAQSALENLHTEVMGSVVEVDETDTDSDSVSMEDLVLVED